MQSARRSSTSSPDSSSAVQISLLIEVAMCGSALLVEDTGSGIAGGTARVSSAIRDDPKAIGTCILALSLGEGKVTVGDTCQARGHDGASRKFTIRVSEEEFPRVISRGGKA